jgi:hypothetical protein
MGVFAIGDAAYYATPDLRLAVGGSYLLGDLSVHASTEYMFHGLGMPLSLTGDARLHNNGSATFTVGLKGYFGGNDDDKSLMDRQRQDDPPDRAIDLFAAAGSQMFDKPAKSTGPGPDTEAACIASEGTADTPSWGGWDGETCYFLLG